MAQQGEARGATVLRCERQLRVRMWRRLTLRLGRRRNKEVRMVTLCGPAGVGKTCLARAAASHLYERRWFVEGCVCIELRGKKTEEEVCALLDRWEWGVVGWTAGWVKPWAS